jgi:transcriptional regulator with XRE-family HTH domain
VILLHKIIDGLEGFGGMKRLKELREYRKITQLNLAQEFNVSQSTIAMWEAGKRDPDSDMVRKLADYFNVSIDYLLGRSNYPHEGEIAAAHINGGFSYEDLTPEAIQQLEEYKQFLIQKYGKKK